MQTIHKPEELQRLMLEARASGKRVGLVPTMGNLHAGHASLVDIARREADVVVVSLFVNPTQFAPNEDYEKYPRTLEADEKVCAQHGADIVFAPSPNAIYAKDASTFVEENSCSHGLCGRYRPTHFRGVCTVVNLLFNLAQPTVAVFGQKDAQQAAVLKHMVRDLHIPVKIIVAPIVREADGLALSSRNQYLSERERAAAPKIFATLKSVAEKFSRAKVPSIRDYAPQEHKSVGRTPDGSGASGSDSQRCASYGLFSREQSHRDYAPNNCVSEGNKISVGGPAHFSASEVDAETLRAELDAKLRESELLEPQYVEIVDSETMQSLEKICHGHTLIAVAAYTAETRTRLIDNILI